MLEYPFKTNHVLDPKQVVSSNSHLYVVVFFKALTANVLVIGESGQKTYILEENDKHIL